MSLARSLSLQLGARTQLVAPFVQVSSQRASEEDYTTRWCLRPSPRQPFERPRSQLNGQLPSRPTIRRWIWRGLPHLMTTRPPSSTVSNRAPISRRGRVSRPSHRQCLRTRRLLVPLRRLYDVCPSLSSVSVSVSVSLTLSHLGARTQLVGQRGRHAQVRAHQAAADRAVARRGRRLQHVGRPLRLRLLQRRLRVTRPQPSPCQSAPIKA